MERLLPMLQHDYGVERMMRKARTPSLMRKDHQHVLNLLGKRWTTRELSVQNARPLDEPMPWVAGATGAAYAGDRRWLDQLDHLITQVPIKLR